MIGGKNIRFKKPWMRMLNVCIFYGCCLAHIRFLILIFNIKIFHAESFVKLPDKNWTGRTGSVKA